jgi:hypothetical protein
MAWHQSGGQNVVYSTFLSAACPGRYGRRRVLRRRGREAALCQYDGPADIRLGPQTREVIMDPVEGQAKAIIAAALIVRGAVEVPAIPTSRQHMPDSAGLRLRELTDYVYRLVTTEEPQEAQ